MWRHNVAELSFPRQNVLDPAASVVSNGTNWHETLLNLLFSKIRESLYKVVANNIVHYAKLNMSQTLWSPSRLVWSADSDVSS